MHQNKIRKVKDTNQIKEVKSKLIRLILIVTGTFFLSLGILGIFLPILPTTPFLLLSAACYARGSKRFYNWLMNTKGIGKYIRNYREGKGVPIKVKVITVLLLWITIILSVVFFINDIILRIILIAIAVSITIHIITIRTLRKNKNS